MRTVIALGLLGVCGSASAQTMVCEVGTELHPADRAFDAWILSESWIHRDDFNDCEKRSKAHLKLAKDVLNPRGDWGGKLEPCIPDGTYGNVVNAYFGMIYNITGAEALSRKASEKTSIDCDMEAQASITDGHVRLSKVFEHDMPIVRQIDTLWHEYLHDKWGPHTHNGCLQASADEYDDFCVGDNFCCDYAWYTKNPMGVYQMEIIAAAAMLRGIFLDPMERVDPERAEQLRELSRDNINAMLYSSFKVTPCVYLDVNDKINNSNCKADPALPQTSISSCDGMECVQVKPEPEPEPEPEPDPCDDDDNWHKTVHPDGMCWAFVCKGLDATYDRGEQCGCEEWNAFDKQTGCDVVLCEWPDGNLDVVDEDCPEEPDGDADEGEGEREGTVTIFEQHQCEWREWSDDECEAVVCYRAGVIDPEIPWQDGWKCDTDPIPQ